MKDNMKTLLKDFFLRNKLDYIDQTFVIAVSTGIDSSVLLDLFLEFQKENNIHIVVAHVNHHRRAQSETEEDYIKTYCNNKSLPLYVKELYFDDIDDNFQKAARLERYTFFEEVINKEKAKYLVLAHHGNDNVETVLMRIFRGSSLAGYSGIQEITIGNNYKIIRPMLTISKDEIINYQKLHTIKYYEDESNNSNDYTRNRLRHDVIPLLIKEYPDIINKISEFSNTIYNSSEVVNGLRDDFIEKHVLREDSLIEIERKSFCNLSTYMKEEVLFEILKKDSLSKGSIQELIKVIESRNGSKKIFYKNIFDFVIQYDRIIIDYNHKEVCKTKVNFEVTGVGDFVINDKMKLNVIKMDPKYLTNNDELWYNSSMLPVVVRSRKPGDKIKLSAGYKKVKDLLIDMKIDRYERDNLMLVEDKNNEILCILGIKKSIVLKNINDCDIIIRLKKTEGI